jgi:hypothetical protein
VGDGVGAGVARVGAELVGGVGAVGADPGALEVVQDAEKPCLVYWASDLNLSV